MKEVAATRNAAEESQKEVDRLRQELDALHEGHVAAQRTAEAEAHEKAAAWEAERASLAAELATAQDELSSMRGKAQGSDTAKVRSIRDIPA